MMNLLHWVYDLCVFSLQDHTSKWTGNSRLMPLLTFHWLTKAQMTDLHETPHRCKNISTQKGRSCTFWFSEKLKMQRLISRWTWSLFSVLLVFHTSWKSRLGGSRTTGPVLGVCTLIMATVLGMRIQPGVAGWTTVDQRIWDCICRDE